MGNLILVFFSRVLSNMLDTAKMILTQRSRAILASLALTLSSLAFNITVKLIADADGWLMIVIASLASGIGCYLAILVADRYFKEIRVRTILSDRKEVTQAFRDYLAKHHITNIALDSYTHGSWEEKSVTLVAIPTTRKEDKIICDYIKLLSDQGIKVKVV